MNKENSLSWSEFLASSGSLKNPVDKIGPTTDKLPAEKMTVDPKTGGMKASKPCQLGFVDPVALEKLGEVAGFGAEKYDKFNYLKGYDWTLSINALYRHFLAFQNGEDLDPESGLPHMAHAAWHALNLVSFLERDLGTDDRFKQELEDGE